MKKNKIFFCCVFFLRGGGSRVSEYPLQRTQLKKKNKKKHYFFLCVFTWGRGGAERKSKGIFFYNPNIFFLRGEGGETGGLV